MSRADYYRNRIYKEPFFLRTSTWIVGIIIILGGAIGIPCCAYAKSESTAIGHIKEKTAVSVKNGYKYLVFTDNEVFEVNDTIVFGRWNSSDLYNSLEKDATYKFTCAGWRVPFLSWYRNILKAEKVSR